MAYYHVSPCDKVVELDGEPSLPQVYGAISSLIPDATSFACISKDNGNIYVLVDGPQGKRQVILKRLDSARGWLAHIPGSP